MIGIFLFGELHRDPTNSGLTRREMEAQATRCFLAEGRYRNQSGTGGSDFQRLFSGLAARLTSLRITLPSRMSRLLPPKSGFVNAYLVFAFRSAANCLCSLLNFGGIMYWQ